MMAVTMVLITLVLTSHTVVADVEAEPICNIEKRWIDDSLPDGAFVRIRGRITEDYSKVLEEYNITFGLPKETNLGYGGWDYEITDKCGTALVLFDNRIQCPNEIDISGVYDEYESDAGILFIYSKNATCK